MIRWIYSRFEPLIQSAITNRILKFHQAMIDRGQIPGPPMADNPRVIGHCTEVDNSVAGQSQDRGVPLCLRVQS